MNATVFGEGRARVVQFYEQAAALAVREQARRLVTRVGTGGHRGEHAAVKARNLARLFLAEFYGSAVEGQLDARGEVVDVELSGERVIGLLRAFDAEDFQAVHVAQAVGDVKVRVVEDRVE